MNQKELDQIDERKSEQPPAFEMRGGYKAWIVGTHEEDANGQKTSKCAILIEAEFLGEEPRQFIYRGDRPGSTHFRAEIEAARGAIEAVQEGSNLTIYSRSQGFVKAMRNPAGRKCHFDLWELAERAKRSRNLVKLCVKWDECDQRAEPYNSLRKALKKNHRRP